MNATLKYDHVHMVPYTPQAAVVPGTIVKLPDGRAAVVPGQDQIPANTEGIVDAANKIYEVPKASATVFADGAEVGWDVSAGLAVLATSNDSDYSIGKAVLGGAGDGETVVMVALNMHRSDSRDANGQLVGLGLQLNKVPTANPTVAGRVWSDAGTLKVSAG